MLKSKKIFDIIPPKTEKEVLPLTPWQGKVSKEKSTFKKSLIFIFAILLTFAVFIFFLPLSKAEIEIWPKLETLKFQKEFEINEKMTESDVTIWLEKGVIPGKFLVEEKETSHQFSSSGIIEKKAAAKGQIRVHNKSSLPVTLIAGTHFMADSGKQFHSSKKITISAKGYLDFEVEADAPGQNYNIEPSKFSVPGLRKYSPELFYNVWGESFSPMEGGFIGKVSQVTQGDLDQAESVLVEELLKEEKESFKKAVPPGFILLEEASKEQILEKSSLAKAGQELESFVSRAKISLRALIFKKSDLEDFAKGYIYSQLKPGKKIHEESLELKYWPRFIDLEAGKINLSLEFEAKIYSDIDLSALKQKIKGRPYTDVKSFLVKEPEIFKAQVKIWPFWVKKIPFGEEKIKIKLNLTP